MEIPKKIVWLVSYPKSGNTWFRAFLSALFNKGVVDINDLKTEGIFSSRIFFEAYTGLESSELTDEEVKILQPQVFNQMAVEHPKERLFIKVHDAYGFNRLQKPIIPTEGTVGAIYFVRNPLDVVSSLANHYSLTVEEAIVMLNTPDCQLSRPSVNKCWRIQLQQAILSWSGHLQSWMEVSAFPVLFLRYEDMYADTFKAFKQAITFLGYSSVSDDEILLAVQASGFTQLKQQEQRKGFVEKVHNNYSFFNKGKPGGWRESLTERQVESIREHHAQLMETFQYYP
ncbi:sulfotransferase domain-containing protein [Mucilaginibacter paludis]|uniref:Sulfotransferase n=1 Tax=Mucilaginibacter paludis DSM 18603 TaxID=714943 RepID=H1Y2B1_9SPHI|nr:sulfotransferase domain-containing protein [Mucilaginibacter paludis]EHQ27891.1 sulfotransferase [Mucilaginibacter paludis DSM 18603]